MTSEVIVAEAWLYQTLADAFTADSLQVYSGAGPQDAEYPFIVFAHLHSYDLAGVGVFRYLTQAEYVVRAAARDESWTTVLAYANTIDAALHGKKGIDVPVGLATGRVLSCIRTEPFMQRETADGQVYVSLGGVYQLNMQG